VNPLLYMASPSNAPRKKKLCMQAKLLDTLLDIIAVHAGQYSILHGLHYLTKLFQLPALEAEREAKKKKTARPQAAAKTLEKDVAKLVSFFDKRHLFIKIHMIYKASVASNVAGIGAGGSDATQPHHGVFTKVAKFYHVITLSPPAQPLLKNLHKVEEYAEELRRVPNMFVAKEHD